MRASQLRKSPNPPSSSNPRLKGTEIETNKQPVLGIIGLHTKWAREESSAEVVERGGDLWPEYVPFHRAVAKGADPVANKVPTPEAASGIVDAASRLDGRTDLIIGDCGYMWASREHLYGRTSTPAITSGLEFLDLALRMTNRPVGIITWDAKPLIPLLEDHPDYDRLRLLSVSDLSEWRKIASTYEGPEGWTKEGMAQQFADQLAAAFAEDGVFADVSILVLECTTVSDFRQTIRTVTAVPVLDLIQFAKAALD